VREKKIRCALLVPAAKKETARGQLAVARALPAREKEAMQRDVMIPL
jgi:hypothetical protein